MKQSQWFIVAAVALGVMNWLLDAYISHAYYHPGIAFLNLLLLDIPDHDLYYRSIMFFTITLSGVVISRLFESRERARQDLVAANAELETRVEDRTRELMVAKERVEKELHRRILAEDKVKTREEYFKCLIENSSDIINVVDKDGIVRYCSPTVKRLLGHGPEEIVGRQVVSLVHPDDVANTEVMLRTALSTVGHVTSVETRTRHPNGPWRVFESIGQSHVDPESGERFVVVNSRDITARKHMEQHLAESEVKYRRLSQEFSTLLDAMPERIALLSRDLTVLWANKVGATGAGGERKDIRGARCYTLWHDQSQACDDCPVVRSLRTGSPEGGRTSDRAGRVWETRAIPIEAQQGQVGTVMVISSDITRRLAIEEEAILNARLASIGQLAAGVAHEINNPINGIINYAQLLLNKAPEGTREQDTLKGIVKEGGRIASIVRGLLSFSRQTDEKKSLIPVQKILDETLTLVRSQIAREGVALDLAVEPGLPLVRANMQQMQQVFLNLIDNSLYALRKKYPGLHRDKTLMVAAEKVLTDRGPSVRITFFDKGTGIPADSLGKIRLPFFTTKPAGEGTGLGLSVSYGIVRDHGGEIAIESAEGEFTKVVITLPAAGEA